GRRVPPPPGPPPPPASGKEKSGPAPSHNVTEPGPACAAAGIQRVPTMQAMAKSVTSRRPISRLRPGGDSAVWDIVPVYSGAAYAVRRFDRRRMTPQAVVARNGVSRDLPPQWPSGTLRPT